jgi:hypothetical protein
MGKFDSVRNLLNPPAAVDGIGNPNSGLMLGDQLLPGFGIAILELGLEAFLKKCGDGASDAGSNILYFLSCLSGSEFHRHTRFHFFFLS